MRSLLYARHGVEDFDIRASGQGAGEEAGSFLMLFNFIFLVVGVVSLVTGGIVIANILLASVEQRTREIGLRMSIGARRRDILQQFLLEALMLGLLGASAGVLVGLGLPLLARLLFHGIRIEISLLSVALAFLFSCAVAMLFGVVPAWLLEVIDSYARALIGR